MNKKILIQFFLFSYLVSVLFFITYSLNTEINNRKFKKEIKIYSKEKYKLINNITYNSKSLGDNNIHIKLNLVK